MVEELKLKMEEKDLLRLKGIFDSIGFQFFLVQGTLLGAIRDGTLIEYDKDFDLGTFEDLDDVLMQTELDIVLKREGLRFEFRGPDKNPRYPKYWLFIKGLKWEVALLPCKKTDKFVSMATSPLKYPAELFDTLVLYDFLGTEFYVPHSPEEWLKFNYGETWRTHARRATIVKGADPTEIYRKPLLEKVYLKCNPDGSFPDPLESIGPQLD